jgi:hypothetical protein
MIQTILNIMFCQKTYITSSTKGGICVCMFIYIYMWWPPPCTYPFCTFTGIYGVFAYFGVYIFLTFFRRS